MFFPSFAENCYLSPAIDFLGLFKSLLNVDVATYTFWHGGRGVVVKALQTEHQLPRVRIRFF